MALIDFVFGVIRCVVFIYDIVTYPVYSITQQSWKDRTKQNLGNVSLIKDYLGLIFEPYKDLAGMLMTPK